ncbi:MAG: hypothetical protein U0746_19465 [Gemmataceae bacterium]
MITVSNHATNATVSTAFTADGQTTTEAVRSAFIVVDGVDHNGTIAVAGPPKWSADFSNVPTGTGAMFKVNGATEGATSSNITVV